MHPSAKGVMARNRVCVRQQYTKLSLVSHSMISRLLLVRVEDDLVAVGATGYGVQSIYSVADPETPRGVGANSLIN